MSLFMAAAGQVYDGVSIWDVTDPENPVLVGSIQGSNFNDTHTLVRLPDGLRLFVYSVVSGRVVHTDISDPSTPVEADDIAGQPNSGWFGLAHPDGDHAIVTHANHDRVSTYTLAGGAIAVADALAPGGGSIDRPMQAVLSASGAYLYVVCSLSDTLAVVDISDPADLSLAAEHDLSGSLADCEGVARVGSTLFVTGIADDRLWAFDLTDETTVNTTPLGFVNLPDRPRIVAISADAAYAYVWCKTGTNVVPQIAVVSIADPSAMSVVGTLTMPTFFGFGANVKQWAVGADGILYVPGGIEGDTVYMVDAVSDPSTPAIIHTMTDTTRLDGCENVIAWGDLPAVCKPTIDSIDVVGPTTVRINGDAYAYCGSVSGDPPSHAGTRIRIATQAAPTTYIIDTTVSDELTTPLVSGLPTGADLVAYISYIDADDGVSPFSDGVNFATPDVGVPCAPVIALAESVPGEATVEVTGGFCHEDSDTAITFVQWQVDQTSDAFANLTEDFETDDPLDTFLVGDLGFSVDVWVRARWLDEHGVYGPWSNTVSFTSEAEPTDAPAAPTISLVEIHGALRATFASSAYSSPVADPQGAAQWQTSWNQSQWSGAFTNENVVSTDPAIWAEWMAETLIPGRANYVRKRDRDTTGRWGEWSNVLTVQMPAWPWPVVVTAPRQGAVLTGIVDLVWYARPDQPIDSVFHAEYSIDGGNTWVSLFTNLAAESYEWDTSGLPSTQALLLRIWWTRSGYPDGFQSLPASYVYHVDHGVGFAFEADQDDPDAWEERWQSYAANWAPGGKRVSWAGVQTDLPTQNPWRQGYAAMAWNGIGEPDSAEIIIQARLGSGDPGPSSPSDGLRYLPRQGQAIAVGFMVGGEVPDTGPPYDALDTDGMRGFMLRFSPSDAPWPYGWKPCGGGALIFPNWRCGVWSPTGGGRQRGTAASALWLGAWDDVSANPWVPTQVTFPYETAVEWVEVYEEFFDMDCMPDTDPPCANFETPTNTCARCEDPFLSSLPFGLRLRVDTIRVNPNGTRDFRIRGAVHGPALAFSSAPGGWMIDEVRTGIGLSCGMPAFAARALQWYGSPFAVFEGMTVVPASYNGCDEPALALCESDWDFTIFEHDDVTPWYGEADGEGNVLEADFWTDRDCPRPYLHPPRDFSETEIDFPAGASTIGAIRVGVVDKRTIEDDPDSGIVTARVGNAEPGTARGVSGRRAVLRRFRADVGMVTVFDGVITSFEVGGDDVVSYWFNLRDPRERERHTSLFTRNETFSVWPEAGPASPYGTLPDGGVMIPAAPTETAVFERVSGATPDDGIHFGYVDIEPLSEPVLSRDRGVVTDWGLLEPFYMPVIDPFTGTYRYEDLTIRWRPAAGGAWTYLRRMPRINRRFIVGRGTSTPRPGFVFRHVPGLYFGSFEGGDIPTEGMEIEYQVLAVQTTRDTPFFWDAGTFGDLLGAIYAGDFTQAPPRIRYNAAEVAAWAADTPRARFIAEEPADNLREWVQDNIYAPLGYAPSFDVDMRIVPAPWELPPADTALPVLDVDWIIPAGMWEQDVGSIINRVRYRYYRESIAPQETVVQRKTRRFLGIPIGSRTITVEGELTAWERYIREEVIIDRLFAPSTVLAENTISYEPETVRAIGNVDGRPMGGDTQDELGAQLAEKIATMVHTRFGWGAPVFHAGVRSGMAHGPTFDPHTLDLNVGDWVIVNIPWMPDYPSGFRGARRVMQIKSITDPDIAHRRITFQDGGAIDGEGGAGAALLPPTLGYVSIVDGAVVVDVEAFPAGMPDTYVARVEYAVSVTEPGASSGLWRFLGVLDAPGTLTSPPIPAGSRVWVRARGEAPGRRPSAWTDGAFVDIGNTPALTLLTARLVGSLPVVTFGGNDFASGVRIRYSVGAFGHDPSSAYTVWDDAAIGDSPVALAGVSVAGNEEIWIGVTPHSTYVGGVVGGEAGEEWFVVVGRDDPDPPAVTGAAAAVVDFGDCDYTTPLGIEVSWTTSGTTSGHTVTVEVSEDGGAWASVASGLSPGAGNTTDTINGIEHDPASGVRTERRYRVRLVRTADSTIVSSVVTSAAITYDVPCAS